MNPLIVFKFIPKSFLNFILVGGLMFLMLGGLNPTGYFEQWGSDLVFIAILLFIGVRLV